MNNISSCLICWLNDKGCCSQSYCNKNNMPEISILVDSYGVQNNNNVMIRFLNMIKERVLFGTDTLHLYIEGHTKNHCDRAFNSLQVLYWKKTNLLLRSAVKF